MTKLLISAILSLFILACKRQELEDTYRFIAHIPITTNWTESLIDRNDIANVAISAYPTDGGKPISILSDNIFFNIIQLPIGEYNVLIHNELLGDVAGIENESTDQFDNILSRVRPIKNPKFLYDTLRPNDIVAEPHNIISTWAVRQIVVNQQMVDLTRSEEYTQYIKESVSITKALMNDDGTKSEADFIMPTLPTVSTVEDGADKELATKTLEHFSKIMPQCENCIMRFHVRVKNLNNAMKIEAVLRGMGYGAYLTNYNQENIEDKDVVYQDIVKRRTYDDPNKGIDGYFDLDINTFGAKKRDSYSLDLCIALNDGKLMKFCCDITKEIVESGHRRYIAIDLGTIENPAITLPPCRDAGFNVDGWDDEIIVDIN